MKWNNFQVMPIYSIMINTLWVRNNQIKNLGIEPVYILMETLMSNNDSQGNVVSLIIYAQSSTERDICLLLKALGGKMSLFPYWGFF